MANQESQDLSPHVADPNDSCHSSPVPVSSHSPLGSAPPLSLAEPSPQTQDESRDGSAKKDNSDEVKAHESDLLEQARVEQETQDLEAIHRRRLQTSPPGPPPVIIGAPLGKNLTPLEAASRLVSQWEAIHLATLSETPEAAGPVFESLTRARADLAAIQQSASPETTTPLNSLESHKQEAVFSRIEFLQSSLEESTFPPERANISAAVSLYRSSRIPYSANWALIYAGHLVDFAPTYSSFTSDRAARLDRYEKLHGPGWLWFEPPLSRAAGPLFSASRGTWLPEADTCFDMGHYSVTMSFRRMLNIVHRPPRPKDAPAPDWRVHPSDTESESPLSPTPQRPPSEKAPPTRLRRSRHSRHPHMTRDQGGTTLHFRMLLDSGATLPMLYERDFEALGIDRTSYAAVTRVAVETVSDSALMTWLYEMQVSIEDTNTCSSLVSSTSPVWPLEHHSLGGIIPVMMRNPQRASGQTTAYSAPGGKTGPYAKTREGRTTFMKTVVDWAEGRDYGRLSGLLPFKCCYVQSTPGLKTMWLGEDRRDVLGAQKMPGQMRWSPGWGRECDPGQPRELWKGFCGGGKSEGYKSDDGRPILLRMAHEDANGVRMVDVEDNGWKGRSEVLIVDGKGVRTKHIIEPRSLPTQQTDKRRRME